MILARFGGGVRHPGSARCRLSALPVLSLSLVLAAASAPAAAEIFKCTAKRAIPTYQNFPCEFESLDGATSVAAPASGMTAHTSATGSGERKAAKPPATIPRVGMTSEEVKAIWGDPIGTIKEEYARGDIETWTYADSRSIRFDPKGRVTEITW